MVLTIPVYKPINKVSDIAPGGIGRNSGGGIVRFEMRVLTRYGVVVVDFGQFKDILSYRDSLSVEGAGGNWTVRMRAISCNEELLKKIHPGMVIETYCARNDDPLIGVNFDPSEIERIDTTPELPELAVVQPISPITGGSSPGFTGGGTQASDLTPEERAFLDTIAYAEGTSGADGYNTMFGYAKFDSFADHPRSIQSGGGYSSDAAGRYQFLSTTWDGLGLSDFSPANQDRGAIELIRRRGALEDVRAGNFEQAIYGTNREWASLPGSPYGQPTRSMSELRRVYDEALAKYRSGGGTTTTAVTTPTPAPAPTSTPSVFSSAGSGLSSTASTTVTTEPYQLRIEKIPAHPNNYRQTRQTPISRVVLHETVGSAESTISVFQDPSYQASYNFMIRRDGSVVEFVPLESEAYGAYGANSGSVHISFESPVDGRGNAPTHSGYTREQYQAAAELIKQNNLQSFPVTTHEEVDTTGERVDPRSFDNALFQSFLSGAASTVSGGTTTQPIGGSAPVIAEVIGPEVEPVEDPYLDKCPYLLMRGVVTDYGRSTDDSATTLVLSGESYGKIYKEAFVLADILAPELAQTSLEVRNATRVPLGVSYIYYRLLKEWVEEFWGQTTGWEVRTRPIPFPPNYMTRINNEGSVWSNLEFLAIQGFFHIFVDHTGAIVWEKLPWSSRDQSLITGRNWEDLQKQDLPSWKIVTWGDRLSEQGVTNFIRCIPTQQGISGGNGSMGYRSLVYNMGSIRQYGGPTKRELMFPVGTSQDQYYTSEARKEQAATNVAFVDLCALESIRWYDRPVQRVSVSVRGEAAWRINTRLELTENWHCADAKPAQYYITSRTNQIDVLRSTWTTQLDLVRDRRKRYLGIGVGEVPIIQGNTTASENSEIEAAIQASGTLAPAEGVDLSFDELGADVMANSEKTVSPKLDLSFGTSDVSPSIFSDVGQGLTANDNSDAPDLFGAVGAGLGEAESATPETAIVTPTGTPDVLGEAPTVAEDEAYLELPLVPDEYWFLNRFTGRVEPIGNDPIKWANEEIIPKIGQAPVITQVQPATAPTGTTPVATGPAAPFTPVDRIYTQYLYDESPPGSWDFTLERGGNVVTPIPSPVTGTVTRSEYIPGADGVTGGYGHSIEVTSSDGTVFFFAHMDNRAVQVGQTVQRGQTLGNQGTTGNSTGEHVHMEVGNKSTPRFPRSVSRPIVEEYFNFISGGSANLVGGGF